MPDALDHELYFAELAHELEKLSLTASQREEMVQEVATMLSDGTPIRSLGSASDLARALESEIDAALPENPELSFDFSGLFSSDARERLWNPEDPRIFVPRVMGAGFDINAGALAVRLGLLHPDDLDAEVVAAIPTWLSTALLAVPAGLAAANALTVVGTLRSGKRLARNVALSGRITPSTSRFGAIPTVALPAAVAGWVIGARGGKRDGIIRAALGISINGAVLGSSLISLLATNGRVKPWVAIASGLLPLATQPIVLVGAARLGRARVARPQKGA